jgi:hypothetical protein
MIKHKSFTLALGLLLLALVVPVLHTPSATYAGTEGCTPGYWKNHPESWPPSITPEALIEAFFNPNDWGVVDFPGNPTMMDALTAKGGDVNALMRHAAAAILNAATRDMGLLDYHYDLGEVRNEVIGAFAWGKLEQSKNNLEAANEGVCPLN